MNNMSMKRRCLRCSYEWKQRGSDTPRQCPYCKSPKWNLKRDEVQPVKQLAAPTYSEPEPEYDGETKYDNSDEFRQ